MAKRILVILGCLALVSYALAMPAKAKEEVEEKYDDEEEELEAEEDSDLVPEGGAHLGRYIGSRDKDYAEYHGEDEAYEKGEKHAKAHKAGGVHSHYEDQEQGGYKNHKVESGAHGKHNKEGHEEYDHRDEQGGHQSFKKEGEVYDKHGSDHKGKLEKNQHVKGIEEIEKHGGHGQAGGKVGSEFIKDKGHKSHGFKNVYHKEEYGEHKTFHDEHRESDHKKKYHDEHQDYNHQGGKHLKQHINKGQYDENKQGSDFHKFGKAGQESHKEGGYKKGGNHHAVGDGFKQANGKQHSEGYAQGHHSEGKKVYQHGQHDAGRQQKAHREAAKGHKEYGVHGKAGAYGVQGHAGGYGGHGHAGAYVGEGDRGYYIQDGHVADGYSGGYEDVGDGRHIYFRRG